MRARAQSLVNTAPCCRARARARARPRAHTRAHAHLQRTGHSIFNTALISVIGVLVVELPLCVTLKAMAEKLAAPVGDDNSPTLTNLALNATNATDVQSLTWRPRSLIWPGDWRADGNEQYFAAVEDSDPVGLLAPYWSIQALVASCPYMMSMW